MSTPASPPIAVSADPLDDHELLKAAARLSVDLNLPFAGTLETAGEFELLLTVTPVRLELRQRGDRRGVAVDFSSIDVRSSAGRSLKQPLAKALGIKKRSDPALTVIDATAGWGEDTYLMAGLGCRVLAVERHPVVAVLLRDGMLRAGLAVRVLTADATAMLRRMSRREPADDLPEELSAFFHPDVVYIDPMFPPGRKTAERKPMKMLRVLVGDEDGGAAELLNAALGIARRRVVVKRPPRAEPLGGLTPAHTHEGKGVRYDVYASPDLKPG